MPISGRDATEADLPGVLAIYNEAIRTSSAVYTKQEATLDDRRSWLAARQEQSFPVPIAEDPAERLDFERVGTLREVGTKFGRWLDLVFMQRFLGPRSSRLF